jgi:hypothetical protein
MSGGSALPPGAEELSCYTANLAVYLGEEEACGRIAASVRLAVRPDLGEDLLAFSHHRVPLDDGQLEYKGAGDAEAAMEAIAAEVERSGRCLVVANAGFLDWSTAGPERPAPHLLLLDDARGEEWHAVDRFKALLPSGGEQRPFTGWISTATLARGLTPIVPLRPDQRLRNQHAFGFPRPLPPDGQHQWLERVERSEPNGLEGPWLTETDAALEHLADFWTGLDERPERTRLLDDMWAASQHHAFRYGYLLSKTEEPRVLEEARRAWRDLPMALRFAVESMERGRHRPTLIARTFAALRRIESEAASLLKAGGGRASPVVGAARGA